jgi:hypothetical protein
MAFRKLRMIAVGIRIPVPLPAFWVPVAFFRPPLLQRFLTVLPNRIPPISPSPFGSEPQMESFYQS